MSFSDDIDTVGEYVKNQHANNKAAADIQSQFVKWYNGLTFWDKSVNDQATYDEARSRRNQFNLANAPTPAAKAQVEKVLATGITSEQMQGKGRPLVDPKTGAVGTQVHNPTAPGLAPGLKRLLKKGVNGDDVKQWQTFLGLTPPTGYFDTLTDTKTRAYQSNNGLKVDGLVGQNTWTKAFGTQATQSVAPSLASALTTKVFAESRGTAGPTPTSTTSAHTSTNLPPKSVEAKLPTSELTVEAGMIPGLEKLPWWAKLLGAIGVGGAAIYGVKKYEAHH